MYRVELKANTCRSWHSRHCRVPNVPCGVESRLHTRRGLSKAWVPNVPCGVESPHKDFCDALVSMLGFLMYRVELKDRKGRGW